ncbi:MAG TPA: rhamnogalacturonan lyase B N-terminal domain-containing protein [Tepidisphaeraceae bacterium]|jgi:rhamnogalacturonan endolyase|nr:rhamnogalacturonan lyase B N-terminal domain-containing protein [Tepidisphaeraceae bacterium]
MQKRYKERVYARRRRSLARFIESLEERTLMAFGLTTTSTSYVVDTGANLTFSVLRMGTSNTVKSGDLISTKFNGTELTAPFSGTGGTGRWSHFESGLSNTTTVVSATVDPQGNWIKITCDDSTGAGSTGVIQYYIARKGFANIYMATYAATPQGEMRFITYTNHGVMTNAPAPSNVSNNTGAIESTDVDGFADGTTASKYYGEYRPIDAQNYGLTGGGFGEFMDIGNRETDAGGPFFKDIDFQTTSSQSTELYNYMFSSHSQTEFSDSAKSQSARLGLYGPYALEFTTGGNPTPVDYSFISGVGLTGYVSVANRGAVSGVASGVPAGHQVTVALANGIGQYWSTPDVNTGAYTISGVKPGTYVETLYQDELAVGTQTVTISAGATTTANIADTLFSPPEVFTIGTFDGTPIGFLNANLFPNMHPSDSRMSPWGTFTDSTDTTAMTNYTVGSSALNTWPMAEWKEAATTANPQPIDNINRITFSLTAAQVVASTLRIGITRSGAGGRPIISTNGGSFSSAPASSTQATGRGVTLGNWRGNNILYTYSISAASLHAGTNTIDIEVASGSSDADPWLGPWITYDAIDLVPTTNMANAPKVSSLTIAPSNTNLLLNSTDSLVAMAKDQFGNPIPIPTEALTWSTTVGSINAMGLFTAGSTTGSGTITASYFDAPSNSTKTVSINIAVVSPLQVGNPSFGYDVAQRVNLIFSRDIDSSMLVSAVILQNLTTQTTVSPSAIRITDANGLVSIGFAGILADGNYQLTIKSGVTLNSAGDQLQSDFILPAFFVLAGDANHDRTVNLLDLDALATNFGESGVNFTGGDFDYSGTVGIADFNLLAGNFGKILATPSSSPVALGTVLHKAPLQSQLTSQVFGETPIGTNLIDVLDASQNQTVVI